MFYHEAIIEQSDPGLKLAELNLVDNYLLLVVAHLLVQLCKCVNNLKVTLASNISIFKI